MLSNTQLNLWILGRKNILAISKELTLDQLNYIAPNSKNNIIWNMGHIAATQQQLIYKLSGNAPLLPNEFIKMFQIGSAPEGPYSEETYQAVRSALKSTTDPFIQHIQEEKFHTFTPYTTMFGASIQNLDSAFQFNQIHESMHFGIILTKLREIKLLMNKE